MASMRSAIANFGVVVCLAACASTRDDLAVARDSLGHGDLLTTIVHLDRIPPTHPEYLEARSLARAVERRMRTSQRLFQRGLHLRAEWRDDEAIESFELARQVWPRIDGVDRMIEATRLRMVALAPTKQPDPSVLPATAVTTTEPIDEIDGADDPAMIGPWRDGLPEPMLVAVETPAAAIVGPQAPESIVSDDPAPAESPDAPSVSPETLRRIQLARATDDLAEGRLEQALDALESLHVRNPGALDVRDLLIRVLHQRGLLLYGQGQLQAALDSWSRILAIDPEYAPAREFHRAAETELRATHSMPAR